MGETDENEDESNKKKADEKEEDGDVAMSDNATKSPKKSEEEMREKLKDAGLSQEDLDLIEQIKKAKGITVSLKMDDFVGLTKEEKVKKFKDVQNQYRQEKKQNIVKQKLEKERRRREGIKASQEAERKRKEYQLKMVAGRKKREKAEAVKRKKAIKQKIAEDKKRRAEQKERAAKKKE